MNWRAVYVFGSRKNERGQALIIVVFAIIGLIGISALAIDGGNAYLERRKAQSAADAAALSGAIARIEGGNWRQAALASALSNGYDNNGVTNTVELNTPPTSGPYVEDANYIQVIITSHLSTFFGPVVGVPELTVSTQAVTQTKPAEYGPMFDGYALVSLAPHSKCDVKRAFIVQGEATLALTGGGVFVNSDNTDCAFIEKGSGSLRIQDDSPFTIVGGTSIQKPDLLTPYPPQTGAIPMSYPPPFQMPKVGCGSKQAEVSTVDSAWMSPGNWGDDFPPDGVTNLQSGVYCIDGDVAVDVGGKLIGEGVVLVVQHGGIHFGGDAMIQLSAPKGGDHKGLLIYLPMDNTSRVVLNGNLDSEYTGTILAPGADVHINGIGSNRGFHSQIVGYYVSVDGLDIIPITYNDEQNYDAFRMPEVQLSQ